MLGVTGMVGNGTTAGGGLGGGNGKERTNSTSNSNNAGNYLAPNSNASGSLMNSGSGNSVDKNVYLQNPYPLINRYKTHT